MTVYSSPTNEPVLPTSKRRRGQFPKRMYLYICSYSPEGDEMVHETIEFTSRYALNKYIIDNGILEYSYREEF